MKLFEAFANFFVGVRPKFAALRPSRRRDAITRVAQGQRTRRWIAVAATVKAVILVCWAALD